MRNLIVFILIFSLTFATTLIVPDNYATIQQGITAAENGDTVKVAPGVYSEQINFNGKSIVVQSWYNDDAYPSYITNTVLDGSGLGSVVTFNTGETENAVLSGFTITNGYAVNGGGIFCSGASPTLQNLLIINNDAQQRGGGVVCYFNSNPILLNVTLSGNTAGSYGGAIFSRDGSTPLIVNSILWNNSPEQIYLYLDGAAAIAYSDIQGGPAAIVHNDNPVFWLSGNLNADPLFQNAGAGRYYIIAISPCIDTGIQDTPIAYDDIIYTIPEIDFNNLAPDMGCMEYNGVTGCTDMEAANFNPQATISDGNCNYTPVIDPIPDYFILEDGSVAVNLNASDQDPEDILTFSAVSNVNGMGLQVIGSLLLASPPDNWFGSAGIQVTVSDGVYTASTSFHLNVTSVNDPPSMDCGLPQFINENSFLANHVMIAEDVDSENLTFDIMVEADLTAFPWIDTEFTWEITGNLVTITPPENWYGQAAITQLVFDESLSDDCSFTLNVLSEENDVILDFGFVSYEDFIVPIMMTNESDVAGFQFVVSDPHYLTLLDVFGGRAEDENFILQYEPQTGLILGFSQTGGTIPAGTGALIYLNFSGWGNAPSCIDNAVVTLEDGIDAFTWPGDCITINFDTGDMNQDGSQDILDVVWIVAIILGQEFPTEYQMWAADLDLDGEINVTDIIILLDIILNQ